MSNRNAPGATPTSPMRMNAADRRLKVLEYRMSGASYRQIAEQLTRAGTKVSHQTVAKDLHRALEELSEEQSAKTQQYRDMELARLDKLWFPQYAAALGGNPSATALCLQITDRRAKLLGLNSDTTTVRVLLEREVEQMIVALRGVLDEESYAKALMTLATTESDA